jgi:hypothetical protein
VNSGAPSRIDLITAWLAVVLAAGLLVLGFSWYGISLEVHHRFWDNMFARFGGPMTFRFFLQPTMAGIAALHAGIRDAREGHKSFFWSVLLDPTQQAGRLREGLIATARIVLLGISMDAIYQFKVLNTFYPAEAVVIAILLAVVPYFVFRWIVEQVAGRWFARGAR